MIVELMDGVVEEYIMWEVLELVIWSWKANLWDLFSLNKLFS